jgi:Uma2 family endonuclease
MMMSLDLMRRFTDAEIVELCRRNPDREFERMPDRRLIVSPPATWFVGIRGARLLAQLGSWNAQFGGGGEVLGPSAGFAFPDESLLAPDATWLDAEHFARVRSQPHQGFVRSAPSLAFEMVSFEDDLLLARQKIEIYVRNGVGRAIMIDPEHRVVEVSSAAALHVPWQDSSLLTIPLTALPGATEPLQIDLDELF